MAIGESSRSTRAIAEVDYAFVAELQVNTSFSVLHSKIEIEKALLLSLLELTEREAVGSIKNKHLQKHEDKKLTKPRKSHDFYELIAVMVIFVLVNSITYLNQERISYNSGQGWDGVTYFKIAEQLSQGQWPHAEAPFVYRIGTPALAALLPIDNLLDSFLLVNLLANTATACLLIILLRMYLSDWKIRFILIAMFMLQWHAPFRFVFFYPAYVDPIFFTFSIASLILLTKLKRKYSTVNLVALSIVISIGVIFREVILLFAFSVPFITNPLNVKIFQWRGIIKKIEKFRFVLLLPLLLGILGLAFMRLLGSQTNNYSFVYTAGSWAWDRSLFSYLLSWFIAFGPILTILIYNIKNALAYLMREQYLFVLLVGYAVLGWIGGSDTERLIYWSMPVVYILIGQAIYNMRKLLFSVPLMLTLFGLQTISQRVFWNIPDYPNNFSHKLPILTPIGEQFPYMDLMAFHGNRMIGLISFLQYCFCFIVLWIWFYNRSLHLKR